MFAKIETNDLRTDSDRAVELAEAGDVRGGCACLMEGLLRAGGCSAPVSVARPPWWRSMKARSPSMWHGTARCSRGAPGSPASISRLPAGGPTEHSSRSGLTTGKG